MPAQHLLADLRRFLAHLLHQIDERMAIGAVQSIGILVARHSHLLHVLAEFDACLGVDLDQFVDTAEGRLSLARYYTGQNDRILEFMVGNNEMSNAPPKCVPMPKQSMRWPCSFRLSIVSSLMSFDATIVSWLNHGTENCRATTSNVSRDNTDKYARSPESMRMPTAR